MVRQANTKDYKKLVSSLRFIFKDNAYISLEYLKQDIKNENCYIMEVDNKIVAIASLVYDKEYNMYYIKRLSVPNKKNRSKGYATSMIKELKEIKPITAVTPWKENVAMQKILEKLGFQYNYTFKENYMLYTSV